MDEAFDHWIDRSDESVLWRVMEHFLEDVPQWIGCYNHPSVILYSIGNEIPEGGS